MAKINQINIDNTVHDIEVKAENVDGTVKNANTTNTIQHYDNRAYDDKTVGWGVENSFYDKNGVRIGFINNHYFGNDRVNLVIGADKGNVEIVNGLCNPTPHNHDDRYYTEGEVNDKINSLNTALEKKQNKGGWTNIIGGTTASNITLADLHIWDYSEMFFVFYGGSDYYFAGLMVPASFQTFIKNRLYFTNDYGYIDVTINFWDSNKPIGTYFKAHDNTIGTDNTLLKVYAR